MTDIERLYVSSVDSKPVNIDWSEATDENGEGFTWWDTFECDFDDEGTDYILLASNGSTVGVLLNGKLYRWGEWEEYAEVWREEDWDAREDEDPPLDEHEFDRLMQEEPYMHGTEGPMMNYWYPVDHITDEDEAEQAAVKLQDVPLCVVEVNGDYGLALTGGGMDLSWDICKAFVLIGALPPVHFADLPDMGPTYADAEVVQAMRRSLNIVKGWMDQRLERLNQKWGDL